MYCLDMYCFEHFKWLSTYGLLKSLKVNKLKSKDRISSVHLLYADNLYNTAFPIGLGNKTDT